jgi:hypothetical protein
MRPDESVFHGASVSGTVDSTYTPAWLCDGLVGRPVRGPAGGGLTLALTATAGACTWAVLANHNLDAAVDAELTGDITATLEGTAARANGIPWNRYVTFTEVQSADGVTLTISGNSVPVVIGELFIGKYRTLTRAMKVGATRAFERFAIDPRAEFGSATAYDKGLRGDVLRGQQYYNEADCALIEAWVESTRDGSLPTVIVPNSADGRAFVVTIRDVSFQDIGNGLRLVSMVFQEYPRSRW